MTAHTAGAVLLAATVLICVAGGVMADPLSIAGLYVTATMAALLGAILSPRLGALYLVVTYYFAMFTAVPALVQIERGQFPFGSTYGRAELNSGFLLMALGQLCLAGGFAFVQARKGVSHARKNVEPLRLASSVSTRLIVRLSILFAVAGAAFAVIGGPAQIFTARFDDTAQAASDDGIATQLLFIARSFTLVGLLMGVLGVKSAAKDGVRSRLVATLAFVAVIAFIVNYPPALPRFQLLGIVLAVIVLLIDFRRPFTKLLFSVIAAAFLLYLFALVKDLRTGFTLAQIGQRDIGAYLVTADFDSFKQAVDTSIYFSTSDFRWGDNFLGAVLFWIPRSFWPSKPVHTGEIVSMGLGYPFNNVSSPLPAEGYAAWGFVGTILVMFLAGCLIARFEGFRRGRDQSVAMTLTYALAAGYATILLRGALNAVAPMILTAFVLAWVVSVVLRARTSELIKYRPVRRRTGDPR